MAWVTCPACRNSKKCPICGGRGVLDHNRTCGGCGGNTRCSYCKGKGQVPG